MSKKLVKPIMVRISEQDSKFLDEFIRRCGGEISPGLAMRFFMTFYRIHYEEKGPERCLIGTVERLMSGVDHE